MSNHKEQRGFLTIARNSETTDYLKLAYVQAMSVKLTQRNNKFALLADKETLSKITDVHEKVFDYIIEFDDNSLFDPTTDFKFYNDHSAIRLTPFKETIKLESDLLLTRSIDHWIYGLRRTTNIYFPTDIVNYRGERVRDPLSRHIFEKNKLPNVYSGFMYYRFTKELVEFYEVINEIVQNWNEVKTCYYGIDEEYPSNDVLYAIACQLYGVEKTTVPTLSVNYNFMHGKPSVHGIGTEENLYDTLFIEFDAPDIRIGGITQLAPVHYYTKSVITDEVIEQYERKLDKKLSSKTRRKR